ncbi:MAG: 3-deoxy-D-manno-octulosonic acid transferase [Spirosomataceae bacterium]
MHLLYNLGISLYTFAIKTIAIFNKKAKLWVEGRKVNYELLFTNKKSLNSKLAWFHCASLGEFEQGRPVIERFRAEFPDYQILLTFFSPSGYEVRKNYAGADYIVYLPADTAQNARKFIETFKPDIVFFVKYEFWRNYLEELHRRQIPTILFSAIFRENQVFFKWYGGFFRQTVSMLSHILVQNNKSAKLLQSIDYQNITIAGDTRFDRVKQIADARKNIEIAERFKNNQEVFIVGSAWDSDMQVLIPFMNHHYLNLNPSPVERDFPFSLKNKHIRFIIAPHEIHHDEIESWRKQIQAKSIRFSEVKDTTQLTDYQVLIIDNIGMLSSLYQYAEYAYIGGSFGKGLHNILEAATFGLPLFFGDKAYHKFQEANDLLALGGAFAISNTTDLKHRFDTVKSNQPTFGLICKNYVLEHIGATEQVIDISKKFIL